MNSVVPIWEIACRSSKIRRIVFAINDERGMDFCFDLGAEFVLAPQYVTNDVELIAYCYSALDETADVVVGLPPKKVELREGLIDNFVNVFSFVNADALLLVGDNNGDGNDSEIKVAVRSDNTAMYFAKPREIGFGNKSSDHNYKDSLGLIALKKEALPKIDVEKPPESDEIEHLTLLKNGVDFYCVSVESLMN